MIFKKARNSLLWPLFVVFMMFVLLLEPGRADPQINLINKGCSPYKALKDLFFDDLLNAAFSDLRKSLLDEKKHFATAHRSNFDNDVFVMSQCRNYMSTHDCVKCFETAAVQIRNCSNAAGARVIYDGCILRYESNWFYDQSTLPHNGRNCGNRTAPDTVVVAVAVQNLVMDLELATPKTSDHYIATKTELTGGGGNVYAVAQCTETVTKTGCQGCLQVASANIQGCFYNTDARAFDVGCFLRYSTTPFFADNQIVDIRLFLEHRGFEFLGNSISSSLIIGGVCGGVGCLLVVVSLLLYFKFLKRQKARRAADIFEGTLLKESLRYNFKDLENATQHFHVKNKLGEGGFGEVYKGILKNGNVVAVKKLTLSSSSRAKAEFDSEVRLISDVHHRNLIRLIGFSSNEGQLLLVYEYMRNGSLDRFLYGEKRGTLNWRQRYDIIIGTALGLSYFHEQSQSCIIHRDIKSSNILLDEDFQPKIADFGLARLMPGDHSHLSTRFAGTLGYAAPEYAIYGHLSERVDTYSFGIVILEIISGRRSTNVKCADFLLKEAWNLYQQDMHHKLVDNTINPDEYKPEEVKKVIGVAMACTQSPASARPSMSSIVAMLSACSPVDQQSIRKPTFVNA